MSILNHITNCKKELEYNYVENVKIELNEIEACLFDINNIINNNKIDEAKKLEYIKEIIWN